MFYTTEQSQYKSIDIVFILEVKAADEASNPQENLNFSFFLSFLWTFSACQAPDTDPIESRPIRKH